MDKYNYSYEKDKKFGHETEIEYINDDGKMVEDCIGCLAYHAQLLLDNPKHEEMIEDYTNDYNEYIWIIQNGWYPVDGYYADVYKEIMDKED